MGGGGGAEDLNHLKILRGFKGAKVADKAGSKGIDIRKGISIEKTIKYGNSGEGGQGMPR